MLVEVIVMAEDTDRVLTVKQVQARLQFSQRTVLRLIERGELRAIRMGRVWRIPVEALREYLAKADNRKDKVPCVRAEEAAHGGQARAR
jgi:excisionase family DNA binding protein